MMSSGNRARPLHSSIKAIEVQSDVSILMGEPHTLMGKILHVVIKHGLKEGTMFTFSKERKDILRYLALKQ